MFTLRRLGRLGPRQRLAKAARILQAAETEVARAWLAAQGPALHAIGADESVVPKAA